jgi:hypothetical protein
MKDVESPASFTEIKTRCFLHYCKVSVISRVGLRLHKALSCDKNKVLSFKRISMQYMSIYVELHKYVARQ